MQESDSAAEVPQRLGVVNGLRGVAILVVLYHHLGSPFLSPFGIGLKEVVGPYLFSRWTVITNGWLGVNLFFVLSGFVLALPYELGNRHMNTLGDARGFLWRRAKRLVPLFYFAVVLALFIQTRALWPYVGSPAGILRLFTFTFMFKEAEFMPPFDFALWSLAVEVGFSLLLPILLFLERRLGMTKSTVLVFLFALGVRYYATATRVGMPTHLEVLKDGPFGRLDDFVLGMAICRLYAKRRLPRPGWAVASIVLGALLVASSAAVWDNVIFAVLPYTTAAFLHDATNIGFGLILVGFLGAPRSVRRLVTLRPLQLCGMMCYSLYVWHVFGVTLRGPPWGLIQLPYVLLVMFLFSAFTYRYIEFPKASFRALFRTFPE